MADSTNKRLRSLTHAIQDGGGRVLNVTKNRHMKIKFVNPQGVTKVLVCAVSPSDWRAERKNIQILARLMAEKPKELALCLWAA